MHFGCGAERKNRHAAPRVLHRPAVVAPGLYPRAITYGVGDRATYKIDTVVLSGGHYTFDIVHNGDRVHLTSPFVGSHNVQNTAAAYVVADSVGIDNAVIASAIADYKGLRRRYEAKGKTANGASVVSDYAHHPSEIEKVIESAHAITRGKACVVFEPHTYSRTKSLITEFSDCFYWADCLILLPTYAAREVPSDGYDTIDLMTHLRRVGEYPLYFGNYASAKGYIDATFLDGDTILVLGAGTIDHLADMLVGKV